MKIAKLLFWAACLLAALGFQGAHRQEKNVSINGFVRQIIFEENPPRSEYFLAGDGNRYRLTASDSLSVYTNRRV